MGIFVGKRRNNGRWYDDVRQTNNEQTYNKNRRLKSNAFRPEIRHFKKPRETRKTDFESYAIYIERSFLFFLNVDIVV